jgi:hypothetical protein
MYASTYFNRHFSRHSINKIAMQLIIVPVAFFCFYGKIQAKQIKCEPVCIPMEIPSMKTTMYEAAVINLNREGPSDGVCPFIFGGSKFNLPNKCTCTNVIESGGNEICKDIVVMQPNQTMDDWVDANINRGGLPPKDGICKDGKVKSYSNYPHLSKVEQGCFCLTGLYEYMEL